MTEADQTERVAKLIARRGICSRREAEKLIDAGRVLVDDKHVERQGERAALDAEIKIDPAGEAELAARVTVVLHKPPGIVSTQPEGDQEAAWRLLTHDRLWRIPGNDSAAVARVLGNPRGCHVAGRLDRDSRGLLVLTQDGVITKLLTGSRQLDKHYLVRCEPDASDAQLAALRRPQRLDGRPLLPFRVAREADGRLHFVLREGKKHQIRRLCRQNGLRVYDLLRTRIGPIGLGDLPEGKWIPLPAQLLRQVGELSEAAP